MSFGALNYVVLLTYLLSMGGIGFLFSRKQHSAEDYFLAGRNMPWLPVAMSMYASLTSAVTYMGLPGIAFSSNISLLVVAFVSPVVAPFLVYFFYPMYRRRKVTTSYEYIDQRFGRLPRHVISGLFLLARIGWLGTVIYAPALALSVVTGISLWQAILLMGLLATLYTVLGGISAVLWTDVVQFVILIGGAIFVALVLVSANPDGLGGVLEIARTSGHIDFNWRISLTEMTVAGVGIGFFFQMMQDYGTDQVTVQRLMATRTDRGVVRAILFNACTDFIIISVLMLIGIGMFAFYQMNPDPGIASLNKDQMMPHFIMTQLPAGISGLLIAAIFAAAMSSMDSGINSMAAVIVNDFIKPARKSEVSPETDVSHARWITLVLGLFSTMAAFYIASLSGIIEAYQSIISLFSAPVLALFLLGMMTRNGRFSAWVAGCVISIPATWYIQYYTDVNWVYYFPFAFCVTFGISLLISGLAGKAAR